MTAYRPQVYTASKLERFRLWLALRADPDWGFCDFTASWPAKVAAGEEEIASPEDFSQHWKRDIVEIKASDFVLLWGRDEGLRGALIECGAGIAFGLRIITIGLPDSHSWSHHPQVIRCENLIQARNQLYTYTISAKRPGGHRKEPADE